MDFVNITAPMKICVISYWSCPMLRLGVLTAGGANVYALYFANFLGELGQKVDIYTPIHKESDDKNILTHPNVRIIHVHKINSDRYTDAPDFANAIKTYIRQQAINYDVIHTHYYYSGLVGLILKKELSLPLVVSFHTLGIMKKRLAGIFDEKRIKAERKIVSEADGIIASTELEARDLLREYYSNPKRIFIVSPGVDHDVFKPYNQDISRKKLKLPLKKKIILFVGRIDPIKGISLLINAIYLITQKHPLFEKKYRVLLIGGDITSRKFWGSEEVKKIRYLIGKHQLDCCIKFLGNKPHDLLPYYYSASDVTVLPSFYESFGLVILEAMACGIAVLGSKVGGLVHLIQDKINGRLFRSNDTSDLADILWELVSNKKKRLKLGQEAYKFSSNYNWKKQAEKIIKVYKNVL